jgi:peptidyl-prolyl cis-trans isomerase B (cyclophilin B)
MKRIDDCIKAAGVVKDAAGKWRTKLTRPAQVAFEPGDTWRARMRTSKGEVVIRLLPEAAPMHVTSFAFLVRLGFYDGLTFHRVITRFMAQGGCPLGSGTGGPGYQFEGEFDSGLKHERPGLLSMANAGPGTDGSQFFLTFVPTPWLDGKHTIFGEVEAGQDALAALEKCGSPSGSTAERLVMEEVTLEIA